MFCIRYSRSNSCYVHIGVHKKNIIQLSDGSFSIQHVHFYKSKAKGTTGVRVMFDIRKFLAAKRQELTGQLLCRRHFAQIADVDLHKN